MSSSFADLAQTFESGRRQAALVSVHVERSMWASENSMHVRMTREMFSIVS